MRVLRNSTIAAIVCVLSVGASVHASGYGRGGTDTAGYYGQPTTTSGSAAPSTRNRSPRHQVIATEIKNVYLFAAKTIRVKVGTKVTWTNKTDTAHNVTFDHNTKVNMDFKPRASVSYTFTRAGTFAYHCEYHPYMKGTVIVTR